MLNPSLVLKFWKLGILVCVSGLLSVLVVNQGQTATYRCKDSSGHTVHTDSPAQLEECKLLSDERVRPPHPPTTQPPTPRPSPPSSSQPTRDYEDPEEEPYQDELALDGDEKSQKDKGGTVTVPVRQYGGSIVVPVNLNNQKSVHLILDTGATMTVLSTDVAIELGLTSDSESQVATVNTAGGPVQVNLTRVKTMGVKGARADNVVVAIHDLPDIQPGIDGLLGMSFLNNFLVTLDSNQGQLHLSHRP